MGLVSEDGTTVRALQIDAPRSRRGALSLIEERASGVTQMPPSGNPVPLSEVQLEAPLPMPRRNIFCVGRNYHAHAKELSGSVFKNNAAKVDTWPIVFTKVPECVVGPTDEVRLPGEAISAQIDYEAELAVVIGKGGRNISREDALSHVLGYTIVNDVTARDVQMRHQQWDLGKSFDTFCPMGPWIVTADEMDGTRHPGPVLGQRRVASGRRDHRPHLRHSDADRNMLARHHAPSRRRDRNRHAGRRRHGLHAAAVPEAGRRGPHRDRRARHAGKPLRLNHGAHPKTQRRQTHASTTTRAAARRASGAACSATTAAIAQGGWPDKPITMIVPFPPGGVADTVARPVAEALSRELKQAVIVENKAGAGGAVGIGFVARAPADGYTVLMSLSSISILPEADAVLERKPAYQMSQFKPIARFTADPTVLVVRADAPWKTLAEFIADARAKPGTYNYGSSGNYGTMHVPMEMLKNSAGFRMLHMPYTGAGPAMVALLAGQVDAVASGPSRVVQQIKAGKLRALAHWGESRWPHCRMCRASNKPATR